MTSSLVLSLQSASRKYFRLKKKVQKSIDGGEFWRYTRRKRHHLLHKIELLKRRLAELKTQLKFAGVGIAAAMLLATAADAQNVETAKLGPFVLNNAKNPLPPPMFEKDAKPSIAYVDLDSDGLTDIVLGHGFHYIEFLKNYGTKTSPRYREAYGPFFDMFIPGVNNDGVNSVTPAFMDIDDDGDLDMVLGMDRTDAGRTQPVPIAFYRNDGTAEEGDFNYAGSGPFEGFEVDSNSWPRFIDFDSDGDKDLILGGIYDDKDKGELATLQVFINRKADKEPGIDATFSKLPSIDNSLYLKWNSSATAQPTFDFADLDQDGDLDFIYSDGTGLLGYRRNDKGVFVEQTGQYTYNKDNPGDSKGNPFAHITQLATLGFTKYRGLTFNDYDDDGDSDLIISLVTSAVSNTDVSTVLIRNDSYGEMSYNPSVPNSVSGVLFGNNANVTFADTDSDGDLDMVVTGNFSVSDSPSECTEYNCPTDFHNFIGALTYTNDNGVYSTPPIQLNPFAGIGLPDDGKVNQVDVDGDGDLDIIIPGFKYDGERVIWFRNDNGTYTDMTKSIPDNPFHFFMTEDIFVQVDFADLNNDGVPDMFVNVEFDFPRVYMNIGEVTNPKYELYTKATAGIENKAQENSAPRLVDLDNDGDLDAVVGKYGNFWYYENAGTATEPRFVQYRDRFNGEEDGDAAFNPFANLSFDNGGDANLHLMDLDNDGDKDLFVGRNNGTFLFFENQNPVPIATPSNTGFVWQPGKAITLDQNITLADTDGDGIQQIIIGLAPYEQGKEKLVLNGTFPKITATFNNIQGILALTGPGTIADYQAALRAVQYVSIDQSAGGRKGASKTGAKSFQKKITVFSLDKDGTFGPSNTTVFNITHSNDNPVLSPGTSTATYSTAAINIAPTITVADADDATLTGAKVSFGSSFRAAEDKLTYNLTGFIGASFDAVTGTMSLTGSGTLAQYEQALRAIQYDNKLGAAANLTPRTLSVVINDGENDSNIASITLNISPSAPVNTAPVAAPASSTLSYVSGNVVLNNLLTLTDDGTNLVSARIAIDTGFVAAEDRLLFTTQNGISGTFDAVTGVLVISGSATVANYQVALRSVQYTNIGTTKTKQKRYINFTAFDGQATSNTSTVSLTVGNTAPTIAGTSSPFWAGGDVVVNSNIVLADADDANLAGATISITTGFSSPQDLLLFGNQNGIVGNYNAATGVLILTGTSSVANYQSALRSIRYNNASATPSTADRVVGFSITDGGAAVQVSTTIKMNRPPDIKEEDLKTYAEGNVALDIEEFLSDPDNNLDLSSLKVVSKQGAEITISGNFVTINYGNKKDYTGFDEITVTVCDAGGQCKTSTFTIEVGADAVIYSGMSPNGDGVNDYFFIQYLPPGTEVAVFNRWGDAIFQSDNYDNNDPAARFEGKNKQGVDVNAGSYFYKIRFADKRVRTGYILLNR